jgi:hypothetical protein
VFGTDPYAFGPRYGLDACCLWLETFEPLFSASGTVCWCEDQEVVVGGEQLDGPGDSHQEGAMIKIPGYVSSRRVESRCRHMDL